MGIRAVFVVFAISLALVSGQKLSYADSPNSYNCEDEVFEYPVPTEHRGRTMKSSYSYYTHSDPTKYVMKYSPAKKYYAPAKKDSRFYEVFQSAGQRAYGHSACGAPPPAPKSPAIQIYVV